MNSFPQQRFPTIPKLIISLYGKRAYHMQSAQHQCLHSLVWEIHCALNSLGSTVAKFLHRKSFFFFNSFTLIQVGTLFLRNTVGLGGETQTWSHLLARVLVLNKDQTMAEGRGAALERGIDTGDTARTKWIREKKWGGGGEEREGRKKEKDYLNYHSGAA